MKRSTPYAPSANNRLVLWIGILLFAVILLRTAWIADDAMITWRTVANNLQGFGPVWNIGERVQTYTHPFWMLALTGVVGVTGEYYYTSLALSIVLSVATLVVLLAYVAVDRMASLLAIAIIVLDKAFVDYSTSGLENPLTHFLLIVFFALVFHSARTTRGLALLSLVAGLAVLNRFDTLLLVAPPLLFVAFKLRHYRWRVIVAMLPALAPFVLWEIFAVVFYGFPLPNTYYAKLSTGVSRIEQLHQGLLYILQSVDTDPLTVAVILAGLVLPWLRRDRFLISVTIGILLYLLYIVNIGGDFMMGRFLTAPFLCALVIVVRQPLAALAAPALAGVLGATIALGVANPAHAPWFTTATYNFTEPDSKGITDERGYYFQRHGLLTASRTNRFFQQGRIAGSVDPQIPFHTLMGQIGFSASPYTHVVDILALTDPLLARLPPWYRPTWVSGHFFRYIPNGYLDALRTGKNLIGDAKLREYYDRLRLVTQGELFDPARWVEIWRFNFGMNDYLIDIEAYRYPNRQVLAWLDFDRTWPETQATAEDHDRSSYRGAAFQTQGIAIDLGERQHASLVDLGINADAFDLIFFDAGDEIGRVSSTSVPLQLGDQRFTVVAAPPEVVERGYNGLVVAPRLDADYRLTRVALLDPARWGASPPHVADLLRLAYFAFYRMTGAPRAELLASVMAAAAQAPAAEWQDVPPQFSVDLLKMPDPGLQALVLSRATLNQVLVDDQDRPLLRYLGHRAEALPADATEAGAHVRLYFEVLAPPREEYTFWFHSQNRESGAEFMLYDWPLPTDAATWSTGMIAEVPVFLALESGEYDLTAGLWTPETRRRLYADRPNDVYWLDLGAHAAEPPASLP